MKRNLLVLLVAVLTSPALRAQVTQINSNKSLEFEYPISNTKAIFVSGTDQTVWVTDGTLAGTVQLSSTIHFVNSLGVISNLDGKLFFAGNEAATGTEIYVTDGTPGGTIQLQDINPGVPGSLPDFETASLNGFLYFTAERPAEGRELWRTDGTPGGTSFVADVIAGPGGSNNPGNYHLFSSGTYLLFAARTPSSGIELWKSNGTGAGTVPLLDINTGHAGADSSNPNSFHLLNNVVLFTATSAAYGGEIWKTDGTAANTVQLADINPGTGSSTAIDIIPGLSYDIFTGFHNFNNRAYFMVYDGINTGTMWGTDGTVANTTLVKNIVPGTSSFILLIGSINLSNKFIFAVADQAGLSELWESNGTAGGTNTFISFDGGEPPFLFPSYTASANSFSQALFQGNKFFFIASTIAEGYELWVSDGVDATAAHTSRVKDINPGAADGVNTGNVSYVYTTAGLFFGATNTANGLELWKSDGTSAGTDIVADIVTGPVGSKTNVASFIINGRVVFEADNGDDITETDLYAVNGIFSPLPVSLTDFTVMSKSADAVLNWHTQQELNSKDFTIQRSFDGAVFQNIGTVAAAGSSAAADAYSFTDIGVMNSGKSIVYYRLLMIDVDGRSSQSPVITLKIKNSGKWNVKLLANPVVTNMKVLLSGVDQPIQLSVLDMNGRKLSVNSFGAVNGQVSLPVGNLPAGTYLLLVEANNEKKVIQFVK